MTVDNKIEYKDINELTRKEFDAILLREDCNINVSGFDSLVILPLRRLHDSGFRCMDFVAFLGNKPICRLSGCSDIIHIDGIGGYGYNWLKRYGTVPEAIKSVAWSIDCLKKSGLLRLFANGKLIAGSALSSFEIYSDPTSNTTN